LKVWNECEQEYKYKGGDKWKNQVTY
jgi:hypothetical protein